MVHTPVQLRTGQVRSLSTVSKGSYPKDPLKESKELAGQGVLWQTLEKKAVLSSCDKLEDACGKTW